MYWEHGANGLQEKDFDMKVEDEDSVKQPWIRGNEEEEWMEDS
jgi:hypothetical protein